MMAKRSMRDLARVADFLDEINDPAVDGIREYSA
jgi:hypothetical protein